MAKSARNAPRSCRGCAAFLPIAQQQSGLHPPKSASNNRATYDDLLQRAVVHEPNLAEVLEEQPQLSDVHLAVRIHVVSVEVRPEEGLDLELLVRQLGQGKSD